MKKMLSILLIFLMSFTAVASASDFFFFGYGLGDNLIIEDEDSESTSNEGSDIETPNEIFDSNTFEIFDSFSMMDFNFPEWVDLENLPAVWNELTDKEIPYNSPDNTIVYNNLKDRCSDSDDKEEFEILTESSHFDLLFSGKDLIIRNLEKEYTGKQKITITCNKVKASFNLDIVGPEDDDQPAFWNHLNDVAIKKNTPDHTMIYHDLALQCIDPDSERKIKVSWGSDKFRLYLKENSLYIDDLSDSLTGKFDIHVKCNDAESGFKLTIYDPDAEPKPKDDVEEIEDNRLIVSNIFINNIDDIMPGELVPLNLVLKADKKMEDVTIKVMIPELAVYDSEGPFDLSHNKKTQKTLFLDIPEYTQAGSYYVMISINAEDARRVVYREIIVV